MDSSIDYTQHTETELVDMFGRMDPRYAPAECARLGKYLADQGYIVTAGITGPGSAVPSSAKLQTLIGSPHPIEWYVDFGSQASGMLGPAENEFGFVGFGTMKTDGISVWISGEVPRRGAEITQLSYNKIANVESEGRFVRFSYNADEVDVDSICLWLPSNAAAEQFVAIMPKRRTKDFRSQAKADVEFRAKVIAQSPRVPVTVALVAANAIVFIATLVAGAEWIIPVGKMQIAWGSNFALYTTDGEWWRLFTSMFIHFGLLHLAFNMFALAMFGPIVERLYGSVNYLLIYIFAGVGGGLASVSWQPNINSAGASGAIFGILGALLAAQLRAGDTFPTDISRPLRTTALLFLGASLYAGFKLQGIDNAAHLGGVVSGFMVGLVAARPITGANSYSRSDLRRSVQLIPAAAVILAVGFWCAQRASASIGGEGLYLRTVHWLVLREPIINGKFNAAMAKDNQNHAALIETLEKEVIPFWREAVDRLAAVELPRNSANESKLETLQDISDGRADAYQLLDDGLRKNDPIVIATAAQNLKQIEQTAGDRNSARIDHVPGAL
jgi:rhomboid protease GluP